MLSEECMEEWRRLTEGFERLEGAMVRLAETQEQTEAALQRLARQCETLVCDIAEIACAIRCTAAGVWLGSRGIGAHMAGMER